jgi:hypothetical protein
LENATLFLSVPACFFLKQAEEEERLSGIKEEIFGILASKKEKK